MKALINGVWHGDIEDTPALRIARAEERKRFFRQAVSADGSTLFAAEPNRYHLYVSYACPWAHRTLIVRALQGLTEAIDVAVVNWHMTDDGWHFSDRDGAIPDPVAGRAFLRDVF